MPKRPGPRKRFLAWSEDRAPWLHTFLTHEGGAWGLARTLVGLALLAGLGILLLWGGTGQPLGEPPVVVIESGSMMHCEGGVNLHGDACAATAFGRLGTIDPGDLVFVRDVEGREDVATFVDAQDAGGRQHHGRPGDVIVYARPGAAPIIHRAMFWVDIHANSTYSIPALGLHYEQSTDRPEISDPERFGLRSHSCSLRLPLQLGPEGSGFVTKGDNNDCWDQGSLFDPGSARSVSPVRPEQILGKARGEVPWIGLLKLFVFDLLGPTQNYAAAPDDLKTFMWGTVVVIVGVPYGVEWALKRKRHRDDKGRGPPRDPGAAGSGGDGAQRGHGKDEAGDDRPPGGSRRQ